MKASCSIGGTGVQCHPPGSGEKTRRHEYSQHTPAPGQGMNNPDASPIRNMVIGGAVMDVDFTGRQVNVTAGLRQYTHQHLRKLDRLLPGNPKLHVILTAE